MTAPFGANTVGAGVATLKDLRLAQAIEKHRLRVIPIGTKGAVRVVGRGVDVTVDRFSRLDLNDLKPLDRSDRECG